MEECSFGRENNVCCGKNKDKGERQPLGFIVQECKNRFSAIRLHY